LPSQQVFSQTELPRFSQTKLTAKRWTLLVFLAFAAALPCQAAFARDTCEKRTEFGSRFVICSFDSRTDRLQLFWRDSEGKPYGGFDTLSSALKRVGKVLAFAMNAGMYQPNTAPVGLFIEGGRQIVPVNKSNGAGNFNLKPNGIFYFGHNSVGVMETERFMKSGIRADYATQSGPMLVIDGAIHPKIEPTGTSEKIRNGVGVRDAHTVVFAISEEPVTFYKFASLFRDVLKCPNALFLDGSISSLYAPSLNRADRWMPMGPIVGVVENGG